MSLIKDYIKRARYLYILASSPINEDTVLEELCYLAHQAVEKAFKGLLLFYKVEPPRTHNINQLLEEIAKHTEINDEIRNSGRLKVYIHETRYPDGYNEVPLDEYQNAITITRRCLDWVQCIVKDELK